MVALREVRTDPPTVPGLAIVVAFVLVLLSIGVLVVYVHHIGESLRVASLIELVGDKTRRLLDETYEHERQVPAAPEVICAPRSGVVNHIGYDQLVDLARAADCTLELVPALGEPVGGDAAGDPGADDYDVEIRLGNLRHRARPRASTSAGSTTS